MSGEYIIKGELKDFSLAYALLRLQRSTRTGLLRIKSGSSVVEVFIKNGDIIYASSNKEEDRLGDLLLKEEKITFEQYNLANSLYKKRGDRLGRIFVELGYLTPKEVFKAVSHHIEEILLNLLGIDEGSYEFEEGVLPSKELITLHLSASNIIYRGIKRLENVMLVRKVCPLPDAVLDFSSKPLNVFQDIKLDDQDKIIFSYINGAYKLKTILTLSPTYDFDTLKTVCALSTIGLITVKREGEAPAAITAERLLKEPEEVSEEFAEYIEEKLDKCDNLGYYEILGVDDKASVEDIRKAYYDQSEKFHPDRHFSLPAHDLKGKLIKIFQYIANAYETLSDTEKREQYNNNPSIKAVVTAEEITDEFPAADITTKQDAALKEDETVDEEKLPESVEAGGEFAIYEDLVGDKGYAETSETTEAESDTVSGKEEDVLKEAEYREADSGIRETADEEDEAVEEDKEPESVEVPDGFKLDEVLAGDEGDVEIEDETEADIFQVSRRKKSRKLIPVVIIVVVVLAAALAGTYKYIQKSPEVPVPPVIKAERGVVTQPPAVGVEVKEGQLKHAAVEGLSLPPFRNVLFRKMLDESTEK